MLVKSDGVIAGIALAPYIFHALDPQLRLEFYAQDGDVVSKGDVLMKVHGKARSILSAERLVLNCMQRMSGIATYTAHLKSLISGTKAELLDTRKTTPTLRFMEKWAVVIGGGKNHRFGLFDMIMLKDNHVDYAGGISEAIHAAHQYKKEHQLDVKIEVETRNLEEVKEALSTQLVDFIMLDNMSIEEMKEAVKIVGGRVPLEASGGITEESIRGIAETGVDFISVGALTHSVKSMDISLKAK